MISLYLNPNITPRGSLVISALNPTAIPMRDFAFENVLQTLIYLVDGAGGYDPNSGNPAYSLRVGIGLPGEELDWVNTDWSAFDHGSGVKGWSGLIATNTQAIKDLFTTLGTNPLHCELEITVIDSNGFQVTDLITPVKIWNRVASDDDLAVSPSPNNTDGEFAIPNGVDTVLVTGLGLSAVPRRVIASVRKPASGLNIQGAIVTATVTTDGFRFDLTGITDASTYKVDYYLIF